MSFKTLFDKAAQISSLANKSAADIGNEVESPQYHEQDIINENRFLPNVDYSSPGSFARYGLAEEYYKQSVERIYDAFPYDGSLKERLEWENESTYLDLHIYNNLYPRTNGYIILSSGSTALGAAVGGSAYAIPTVLEYITVKGGPHPNPDGMSPVASQFTGSNYYNASNNRESNLKFDLKNNGASVEFWMKKSSMANNSYREAIFDLWNNETIGTADYGRFRLALQNDGGNLSFLVTVYSGSTGFDNQQVGNSLTFLDGQWHHYALTVLSASTGIATKLYVDGDLNHNTTLGSSGINDVSAGAFTANIGALVTNPDGAPTFSPVAVGAGKLSGSLDEFRYWKTQRSSKDIGRYWFDQVGGGTNSDPEPFSDTLETVNTNLGVYYKFNEGITGVESTDSTVLDYSGRISNGTWTGYAAGARQTGSAIILSNAATTEFRDPIIYSFHPDVEALESRLAVSGSEHDATNNASIYNSIPAWITEEDADSQFNTKYLTQIMASYFDTLHMQMDAANNLKDIRYVSGSNKQLPFADRLLSSKGFVAPDIFVDADVLEKLADRSEDLLYEKSLTDIKNIVYQNIYNNLAYIYKSKGTEKSFRNLIRCFGIDDELIKLNMYAPNTAYEYRENRRSVLVADRVVNFNTANNKSAVVFSLSSSSGPVGSTGYIPSSTALSGGFAYTLEADVVLPRKLEETSDVYYNTNAISSSIFGIHGAPTSEADTTWPADDSVNFQVYTVRDELDSPNVKFVLTGSSGGHVPLLETAMFEEAYDNTRWNLSVRVKPQNYPLAYFANEAENGSYTVVFTGLEAREGTIVNRFEVTGTVTPPDAAFVTGSRRPFVGAHRTNFTGSLLHTSDVKIAATRFWLDYVDDVALTQHALDSENFGALQPSQYAFPFDTTASYGDIKKSETLTLNWEFSQNTGSNASGQFFVADESSGSAVPLLTRYGDLGNILNRQYTALGYGFAQSSTDAIKKDFVIASRLNDIETVAPAETIEVLNAEEQKLFKIDSRPVDYFFSFEKSMSGVISEQMVNMFGTLKDFNNMIGQPVNRYRPDYKTLNFMRKKFYEKVANSEIDFDHFYEFYKWFDSSLSYMLGELVPASADFAQNIRTVIETTTLERNKYRNKFPFIDEMGMVFETAISSNVDYGDAISSPDDDPQGTGFYPTHAPTRRQVGLSERANINKWKYIHHPSGDDQTQKYLWWKNRAERDQPVISVNSDVDQARGAILNTIRKDVQREAGRPYRFSLGGSKVLGGVGAKQNKNVNFMFGATNAFGPLVEGTNIPENVMVSYDSDVEQLLDTTDEFYPTYKQRIGFGINPRINIDTDVVDKRDGNSVTNFSLYQRTTPLSVYEEEISASWKPGVTITNLHHDYVDSTDIPMQGPFTEKFVGGRQYRHTELNDGTDTRTTRFEGFRIELGIFSSSAHYGAMGVVPPNYPFADTPAGAADLGFLPELAVRSRFREETAKRPVNIKNILMTTESLKTRLSGVLHHNRIGNYSKNYQVVQTTGRTMNDPFFNDQSFSFAQHPETLATRGKMPLDSTITANAGGHLEYTLPDRTGANSNKTVIVNRFSSPGGFEVQSRGYLDPAHEELSVYNALPYRNLGVINYGLSGSASLDPSIQSTIRVKDQIDKPRGLQQRASLHCGPFGIDSAYGSITAGSTRVDGGLGYSETPSWHKVNRNAKAIILSSSSGYSNSVVYDNLFVQHQIPRSEQQYLWITSSLTYGETIYGLDLPVCLTSSVLNKLITRGDNQAKTPFVSLNIRTVDPVTASTHTLGYPLSANASASYDNADYWAPPAFDNGADYFNNLLLTRHGPYQWPTWKQIRVGETKVAQTLRKTNTIGALVPPPLIKDARRGRIVQYVRGKRSNEFVDYVEQPVSSRHYPATICLEDNTENSNSDNNIMMHVTYGNLLDYFSHEDFNNRLNIPAPNLYNNALNTVFEYVTSSQMSVLVNYGERLYPAETNAYRNIVRRRTEFTIDDVWNPNALQRRTLGPREEISGRRNSQNRLIYSASIWPLDGTYDRFPGSSLSDPNTSPTSSAGELVNTYSRLSSSAYPPATRAAATPGATYATRIPAGRTATGQLFVAGDVKWQAAEQSGKDPYVKYEDYSDKIARTGKDHSIVPEFRISSLIEDYVETNQGDFLASLENVLELTGASIPDSSQSSFFKTYTNSDFLKYFSVVDKEINNKRSDSLKIRRDKVALKCSALLKFLPYKGFYPAERTVELASLFSQSYGDSYNITTNVAANAIPASRAILEPLYAPGIMYNTIKSGIAVNNWVMVRGQGLAAALTPQRPGNSTTLPEGNVSFARVLCLDTGSNSAVTQKYSLQKIPFEAIYQPTKYFNREYISGSYIYDTGVAGSDKCAGSIIETDPRPPSILASIKGKKLYELAADNFLCETVEFFKDGLGSFVSAREDSFAPVVQNQEYKMKLTLYRTQDKNGDPDRTAFEMYSRTSAFGAPIAADVNTIAAGTGNSGSFSHVTPPYFASSGSATFTYTAQSTGVPTLDEILANTTISYERAETVPMTDIRRAVNAGEISASRDLRVQLDSCFNLTDYYTEVPEGTNTQKKRWLIQSKFETPVLNFAGVSAATPTGSAVSAGTSSASDIVTRGMWHQYGSIPTDSGVGVFAVIEDSDTNISRNSLANIVNMQTGLPVRIGNVKKENILEEAVVAVPFTNVKNRRKFFEFTSAGRQTETYQRLVGLLDKYVFPPKFDFTRHKTVRPIQMYAFEFSADVTQQDIADMWQNLPPDIADTFEEKEAIVEEEALIKALIEQSDDIQWMIFKVKKRAKKSYDKYRRSLITDDTTAFPETIGQYSYNWPYDYFSLVELVKIDESVQYVSADLTDEPDTKVQIVGDVNVVAANPIPVAPVISLPEGSDR